MRENNFSLLGLTGFDLYGKVAGVVGTGRIGMAMCRICRGFGMRVLAYDKVENAEARAAGVEYVPLAQLLRESDLISLHCPLTDQTYHMINQESIAQMKKDSSLMEVYPGRFFRVQFILDHPEKFNPYTVSLAQEQFNK